MIDTDVAKALGNIYKQMNELGQRIDNLYSQLHKDNAANIDYIAMMADVDIPQKEDEDGRA